MSTRFISSKATGFVSPLIIFIVLVAIAGGSYLGYKKLSVSSQQTINVSPSPNIESPTPTPSPSVKPSQKPTPLPKPSPTAKATTSPSPSPSSQANSNPCSKFDASKGLATITVSLNASNGSIEGDALVQLKASGSCPGQVPNGGTITDVIHQGSSWTSPGLTPGTFRIDVNYHGNGTGTDVDAVSGGNSVTVTVNN